MKELKPRIKLNFILGLKKIVLSEIKKSGLVLIDAEKAEDSDGENIYLEYKQNLEAIKKLHSVQKAFLTLTDKQLTPLYISKHKSVLGNVIKEVIEDSPEEFKTFKIICAGSDSNEVRSIARYVESEFSVSESEESDLKIYIIKLKDVWELGVQITSRPLSQRDYRVRNMEGAMDSTIAYSANLLAGLENKDSYLNIFSGSGTLLIEAALDCPNIKKLIGFDNDKEHISLAIQNIRKAGLLKNISLKEADIFDAPDFGTFDVITSDLPFGMLISKGDDLNKLYEQFIFCCEKTLKADGMLIVYTNETELFVEKIHESKFKVIDRYPLKIISNKGSFLHPELFVCMM